MYLCSINHPLKYKIHKIISIQLFWNWNGSLSAHPTKSVAEPNQNTNDI